MAKKAWVFNPEKVKKVRGDRSHYVFGRSFDPPIPGHSIKDWEQGKAKPGAKNLEALCATVGRSPNYFYS